MVFYFVMNFEIKIYQYINCRAKSMIGCKRFGLYTRFVVYQLIIKYMLSKVMVSSVDITFPVESMIGNWHGALLVWCCYSVEHSSSTKPSTISRQVSDLAKVCALKEL